MFDFKILNGSFRQLFTAILILMLVGILSSRAWAAPKTDIVIFKNGDRLTGEVRSLKRGQLSLKTDATGTIAIEWDKVSNVISNQYIQVEMDTGTRYFGHLLDTEKESRVLVETEFGPQVLDNSGVISMSPIEAARSLEALDVDLTLGYNFAKAGGVKQSTFGIDVDYRTRKRIYSLYASTTINDSDDQTQSTRSNLELVYNRLWQKRWYVAGNLNFDQNDELGLDLRTSLGANIGRYQIQSNTMLLDLKGGLQVSREKLRDNPEEVTSVEALLTTDWDWFLFDNPELDWSTTFQLIPNLSDWGRVRANFDTALKWELINDLKWGISFYSSFDNKTEDEASTIDYGVNTNLAYEF